MAWTQALGGVLDLLAPRQCASCDLTLEPEEDGWCGGCGFVIDEAPAIVRPPATSASAFVYGGPMAEAVRAMKYGGRPELATLLGRMLADAARPYGGRVDVVVPVPLHGARLRARGFNQAALLARPVARVLAVPLDTRRLRRRRHTAVQAGLDAAARTDNVRGAFRARPDASRPRVLLVDDVRTTGATLTACVEALLAAGATEVVTLTLARAE